MPKAAAPSVPINNPHSAIDAPKGITHAGEMLPNAIVPSAPIVALSFLLLPMNKGNQRARFYAKANAQGNRFCRACRAPSPLHRLI